MAINFNQLSERLRRLDKETDEERLDRLMKERANLMDHMHILFSLTIDRRSINQCRENLAELCKTEKELVALKAKLGVSKSEAKISLSYEEIIAWFN